MNTTLKPFSFQFRFSSPKNLNRYLIHIILKLRYSKQKKKWNWKTNKINVRRLVDATLPFCHPAEMRSTCLFFSFKLLYSFLFPQMSAGSSRLKTQQRYFIRKLWTSNALLVFILNWEPMAARSDFIVYFCFV